VLARTGRPAAGRGLCHRCRDAPSATASMAEGTSKRTLSPSSSERTAWRTGAAHMDPASYPSPLSGSVMQGDSAAIQTCEVDHGRSDACEERGG